MPTHQYNSPPGSKSTIDGPGSTQMNTFFWQRKALIEAQKEMYFMPLADVTKMPKHYGKEIRVHHYIPLLDDRNVNDQGIDAAGATMSGSEFQVIFPSATVMVANADSAAAVVTINDNVDDTLVASDGDDDSGGSGLTAITLVGSLSPTYVNATKKNAVVALDVGVTSIASYGNLYGSSKDIGTITGKMPTLTETGGRVNRVGFTRLTLSGSLHKFGFFTEWTQETMDFDSDDELYSHISRELVTGATQLTEAVLQKDLLAAAGVIVYAGAASSDYEITGEGAEISEVVYDDLSRLARILNDNRTPLQTKVIAGSRMIDTKTVSSGRVMYIGSELEATVRGMVDQFDTPAFVPVHMYANATTLLNGEIGSIDRFRFVVVPEMLNWAGAGADVDTNAGYMETNDQYDIYPMLVVGDQSFTTIGFQMDKSAKSMKFKITTKMPGNETADRNDPYGEMGFSSIKWYYGFMALRTERIAIIKTIARI